MENIKVYCELCGVEIPEGTGGFLDDVQVCDACYEHEIQFQDKIEK